MFEKKNVNDLVPHPLHDEFISHCSNAAMRSLELSIKEQGIINPLIINEQNQIIDGSTRWAVAKKLEIKEVLVRIVYPSSEDELLLTLNEVRRDSESDPIRLARRVRKLYDLFGIKRGRKNGHSVQKDASYVADLLKIHQKKMTRLLKLLNLILPIQDLISQQKVGILVGNQIASHLDVEQQNTFCEIINKFEGTKINTTEARTLIQQIENNLINPLPQNDLLQLGDYSSFSDLDKIIVPSSAENIKEVMTNISDAQVEKIVRDVMKIHNDTMSCYEKMQQNISAQCHDKLIISIENLLSFLNDSVVL